MQFCCAILLFYYDVLSFCFNILSFCCSGPNCSYVNLLCYFVVLSFCFKILFFCYSSHSLLFQPNVQLCTSVVLLSYFVSFVVLLCCFATLFYQSIILLCYSVCCFTILSPSLLLRCLTLTCQVGCLEKEETGIGNRNRNRSQNRNRNRKKGINKNELALSVQKVDIKSAIHWLRQLVSQKLIRCIALSNVWITRAWKPSQDLGLEPTVSRQLH